MSDIFSEKEDISQSEGQRSSVDMESIPGEHGDDASPLIIPHHTRETPLEIDKFHQFLDNKIIGVFNFSNNQTLIVYSDGSVQKDETIDPRKISQLQLPFNHGHNVIMTILNEGDFPILIV